MDGIGSLIVGRVGLGIGVAADPMEIVAILVHRFSP
jgi:hypothetical protein